MNEGNKGLKGLLGILALLVVLGALWRVLSYHPGNSTQPARPTKYQVPSGSVSENLLPQNETINELLEEPTPAFQAVQSTQKGPFSPSQQVQLPQRVAYPQNRSTVKQPYPTSAPQGTRYVEQNFYSPDTKTPTAQVGGTTYTPSNYVGPQVSFNTSASSRVQEERSRALAPYLRPNGQEKARMDAQWNKMAAALERAIAKALTPKSKKEEMVEKYAAKSTETSTLQTPGFTGQLAPVGEQIALQKQSMMQSMGNAFGSAAAQQAGEIMDSFAGEVAAALNNPNMTAEQKEQQIKEVTKKYQDKMNKLAEKNQYDKFVADRVAQDNKQKEELGSLYPEQREQIGQLIDQTREKDLALATQNLPRDEYFNQLAQNDQQLRNDIQKVVIQGGKSVQEFHQWEQDKYQDYLKTLTELEEKGEIQSVARVATSDERKQTQAEIEVQSPKILEGFVKSFGEGARKDVASVLSNYEQILKQIDDEELSIAERQTKKVNAMNAANRELFEVGREKIEALNIPEEQKQARIEQLEQAFNIQ